MSARFKSPRPKPPADVTDTTTIDPLALQQARVRWGLDAAPTFATTIKEVEAEELSDAAKHRKRVSEKKGKQIAAKAGTPIDVTRALLNIPMPAEWDRDLRAMSPITDTTSHLRLAWKEPLFTPDLRRLVVYECVPEALIGDERRMFLADTPYWELPQDQRAGRASIVSAFQWEMYRVHRVDARPFWCVQGKDGGTPLSYSDIEKRWLRAMKQPDSPPHLGALPFAPWDNRVKEALVKRDRLAKLGSGIHTLKQRGSAAYLKAEAESLEKEYRKQFLTWFSDTMQEQADVWAWYIGHSEVTHRLPKQSRAEWLASMALEESFIEHGVVPNEVSFLTK
jgi:hypothetical protein